MWEKILNFLKIPNNQRNILIVSLIVIVFLFFKSCQDNNDDINIYKQNQKALLNKIDTLETTNGKIEYAKKLLIADKSDLESLNKQLYEELKVEKGKVKYITITEYKFFPPDTVWLPSEPIYIDKDGNYACLWGYDKSGDGWNKTLKGKTVFTWDTIKHEPKDLSTLITDDILSFRVVSGFRERDGSWETYIRCSYPYANIDFNSAIVDKGMVTKLQKDWHIGILGGIGYGVNRTGFIDVPTIYVGVGILYTPFNFLNF